MPYKLRRWWYDVQVAIHHRREMMRRRNSQIATAILCVATEVQRLRQRAPKKNYWVHPLWQLREIYGFYNALYPVIANHGEMYKNYFRMAPAQLEDLLRLVGPIITKQVTNFRQPIPAAERLCLTLRYLATGDCMTSFSYAYLMGFTTVKNVIKETCEAIWDVLHTDVMPGSYTKAEWLAMAKMYAERWQFPHCIGSVDGKHISIECPPHAGSQFYNYKFDNSIVLMAICDADYNFTFVDIGAPGRRSDGGVFKESEVGLAFHNRRMDLPEPACITVDGSPLPYFLVGDEAFQLTEYMLRPYPGKSLAADHHRIFNFRLSRARRVIENVFGIIVSRWRILKRPIDCTVENTISIVQAIVCLHNWLRRTDVGNDYMPATIDEEYSRQLLVELDNSALGDVPAYSNNNMSRSAKEIREELCIFFENEGAVPFQYDHI